MNRYFPRARTVIIAADGGSRDGTPQIVAQLPSDAAGASGARGTLRTQHHISASYIGGPSKAGAIRLIFAVADLLQARAVALLDPEVTSGTPAWIEALVGAVWRQQFDFAAPLYERHPLEVPLLTQLVRPLLRATYGRRVQEPLIGEFGCSGQFATQCLARDVWDGALAQDGVELWVMSAALEGQVRPCQVSLGPRRLAPTQRPGLREVFPRVIGALFACLEGHAGSWLPRAGSEPLPVLGPDRQPVDKPASLDPAKLGQSFSQDVRDLRPVLESILAPETLATLCTVAESARDLPVRYPADLWIATVYDFLAAHHVGVMGKTHVVQALMPLYLGRVSSFLTERADCGTSDVEEDLERLAQQFEQTKPYLVDRWNRAP